MRGIAPPGGGAVEVLGQPLARTGIADKVNARTDELSGGEQQRVAFDYAGMAGTVCALVVVCVMVDLISLAVRSTLR